MPRYIRFCPICQTEFLAQRISATYCSKKCRNRASKLPADMLEILVKGTNDKTRILNTVPKVVRDFLSKQKNIDSMIENSGMASKNMDAVLTEAEEFALEELKKRKKNNDNLPTLDIE